MSEYIVSMYCETRGVKCEEIVRCRDCRYFRVGTNTDCCVFTEKYAHPDGFCFWACRKEVDE